MNDNNPLNEVRVVSTAPMSVPTSVFVRMENETSADHSLYQNLPGFSATSDLALLTESDQVQQGLDNCLSDIYSRRPIGEILKKHLNQTEGNQEAKSKNCKSLVEQLISIVKVTIDTINNATSFLTKLLKQILKTPGLYSDVVFDAMSEIIYKIFSLDQIHIHKKSLMADIDILQEFLLQNDLNQLKADIESCKKWLSCGNATEIQLQSSLQGYINTSDISKIVKIVWNYLSKVALEESFVKPNLHFAHLTALIFFLRFKPAEIINQQTFEDLKRIFETVPFIPLYHELSLDAFQCLKNLDMFKNTRLVDKSPLPCDIIQELRERFSAASKEIAYFISLSTKVEDSREFILCIKKAFCVINYTKGILRQQYCKILAVPPPGMTKEEREFKPYERAMRCGFSNEDYSAFLQLLSLCRELHDLLLNNAAKIYPILSFSIHAEFQTFIKRKLAKCYNHMLRYKEKLGELYDRMRAIAGDFVKQEKFSMKDKSNKGGAAYEHEITHKKSIPNPQLIELIRIQIQHITNPECEYMIKSSNIFSSSTAFRDKEEKVLLEFIKDSESWIDLISFNQSLANTVDQSDFYFKEVQLDINGVYQFSAKASLPFNLCEYALSDNTKPEITELIFYPLSIYDDAAFVAIHKHHSELMYNEINAEARQAVEMLAVLISEFTFNTFRTFSSFRQLTDNLIAKVNKSITVKISKAYRLRTFITQNQFYFLAKNTNPKNLIAKRVDEQLNSAVIDLYKLSKKYGILASLAISHGLDALRDTHRLLVENGLPLMPFPSIERTGKMDNHPLSFMTTYFSNTISHLFKTMVPKYALFINPHRFIPNQKVTLPSDQLGKNKLGRVMQLATEDTVAFATMSHFSFFVRQCSDGTLSLLFDIVKKQVHSSFDSVLKSYKALQQRITRIKDAIYGSSLVQAFTRYESAYSFLIDDTAVHDFFQSMKVLGNMFIVIEMLDEAMTMRRFSLAHALSVLRSADADGNVRDEIDSIFDESFRSSISQIKSQNPKIAEKLNGLLLSHAFYALIKYVMSEYSTFAESALEPNEPRLPPLQQMTGYAMIWSVLEYVYIQTEITKPPSQKDDEPAGFTKYGSGVPIAAAIIASITRQTALSRLLSIGTKLERAALIDDDGDIPARIQAHINAFINVKAIFEWATLFYESNITSALEEYEKKHKK